MSTKRRLAALAVLVGLVLFADSKAWAAVNPSDEGCNQDEVCREHFVKGKSLYKQQDYTTALQEFQAAYERRQTPILLANIGRTLQKLGRPKEALDYYLRCQEAAKSDTDLQEKLKVYIAESRALVSTSAPTPRVEEPAEPPPAPPSVVPTPVDTRKPIYKKGWFWGVVGGVAGVVLITGIAVGAQRAGALPPDILYPAK